MFFREIDAIKAINSIIFYSFYSLYSIYGIYSFYIIYSIYPFVLSAYHLGGIFAEAHFYLVGYKYENHGCDEGDDT